MNRLGSTTPFAVPGSAYHGFALVDPEGQVLWANHPFLEKMGLEGHDVLGRKFRDVLRVRPLGLSDGGAEMILEALDAVAQHAELQETLVCDGWTLTLCGQPSVVGSANDVLITLHNGPEPYSGRIGSGELDAIHNALECQAIVSATDRHGRITHVNQKFCDISGYTRSELLGKTHNIINSRHHPPSFFKQMWRTIVSGGVWHAEVCNKAKDGALYWVDTTVVPVPDGVGKIQSYISIRFDITGRKTAEHAVRLAAETDPLTELQNRYKFTEVVSDFLNAFPQTKGHGALVMVLDIDFFKDLNDLHGHRCGDDLLRTIAGRLKHHLPEHASVTRLGGDEFAIFLPLKTAPFSPSLMIEALHKALTLPVTLGEMPYHPSISMGCVMFPAFGSTFDELMSRADSALYDAKTLGRSSWVLFNEDAQNRIHRRVYVKRALHDAINKDAIDVAFQPVIELASGQHAGFEALVRITNDSGPLSPCEVIPIAEEYGLIVPLGEAVAKQAMEVMDELSGRGLDPGWLSINISPLQFRCDGLLDSLQGMMQKYSFDPRRLVVELTETALVGRSVDRILEMFAALRDQGIKVALDDFGTGYSSLSHLRAFDVDKIKIDKSFVGGIGSDPKDEGLVCALIHLANCFEIEVVAEGVETATQLGFLEARGCQYSQGFLHAKPMARHDLPSYLSGMQSDAMG